MSDEETGQPLLAAAFLCEKVLQEKDGVLSAIRLVERITLTASGPQRTNKMPEFPVSITALVKFWSGDAKGSRTVKIQSVAPSGFKSPEMSLPIFLEGEERGASLVVNVAFQAREEGLHWFDVYLGDDLVTRMPLRVIYQQMSLGQGGTPVH